MKLEITIHPLSVLGSLSIPFYPDTHALNEVLLCCQRTLWLYPQKFLINSRRLDSIDRDAHNVFPAHPHSANVSQSCLGQTKGPSSTIVFFPVDIRNGESIQRTSPPEPTLTPRTSQPPNLFSQPNTSKKNHCSVKPFDLCHQAEILLGIVHVCLKFTPLYRDQKQKLFVHNEPLFCIIANPFKILYFGDSQILFSVLYFIKSYCGLGLY